MMLSLGQVLRLCSHVVCGGCSSLRLLGPQFFLSLFDLRIFTMLFFRCFLLNLNQASNLLDLSKKKSYLADLYALNKPSNNTVGQPMARPTHWIQPLDMFLNINVDAAVTRNRGRGVAAAICRNQGVFQGASAIVFKGIADPPTVEALAIREALALVEDLNLQSIHVASDLDHRELRGVGRRPAVSL
uniref:RNase H type-1 domain-containing protein n=1 Tax=Aegilops tauschii subsp. strangulata TaxID=200361 RepID=A0A453APT6_AEGTS